MNVLKITPHGVIVHWMKNLRIYKRPNPIIKTVSEMSPCYQSTQKIARLYPGELADSLETVIWTTHSVEEKDEAHHLCRTPCLSDAAL